MGILHEIIILIEIFINISTVVIKSFNFINYVINRWGVVINYLNNLEYFLFVNIDS